MRHLTNFLPELGKVDPDREYVVLVRESFPAIKLEKNIRLERVPEHESSSWLRRIVSDVVEIPRRIRRENFSAIVSLTNFGPIWSPVPHVYFQRNPVYYCPYYLDNIGVRLRLETVLRRKLAVASMMRADVIVTPSQTMGEMIKKLCPETEGRNFKTLYHGFEAGHSAGDAPAQFQEHAAGGGPILFFPSHLGEYKGYRLLFDAIRLLKNRFPQIRLILTIGAEDGEKLFRSYQAHVRRLDIAENVVMIGRVPQDAIWGFYRHSDMMVYPSLCESFGFSMLEAMGEGLPIVAADTGINREICGAAAQYFSPLSPTDCAARVGALLDDVAARNAMRARGAQRVAEFDWGWRRYATEFKSILDGVTL